MDRKIILYIIGAAFFGFVGIMMLMPEQRGDGVVRLPWLVSTDEEGRTRVFGFTIGQTTFGEVRAAFGEEGKINLFTRPDRADEYSVEVYFDQLYLNGLRADFVISLDADQILLGGMYERGLRISQLASGGKKVTLSPQDIETLLSAPIRAITYLPWKSLDSEILEKRFGSPSERFTEANGVIHWLYPSKGMDIGLGKDGGVVIQYVDTRELDALVAPLKGDSARAEQPSQESLGL